VARLAREHFVVETSAYMHDPGLVPQKCARRRWQTRLKTSHVGVITMIEP
jgi:hypothetical protein